MHVLLWRDSAGSLCQQGKFSPQKEGMVTHMPKCDLLSSLALLKHLKGLEVLVVLVLPEQQRKTEEHTVHEEESQTSCPGWQHCSTFLLAVTKPCSMLTLAPLFPTSPGRPRLPSGPGSPCEKGKIFQVREVSKAICVHGSAS